MNYYRKDNDSASARGGYYYTKGSRERQSAPKRKSKAPIIIIAVALILLVAGGTVFVVSALNPDNAFNGQDDGVRPTLPPAGDEYSALAAQADTGFMQGRVNLLVMGIDRYPELALRTNNFHADTLMLFSIDFNSGKVDIISIPRGSYVKMANGDYRKAGYAFYEAADDGEGAKLQMQAVADMLGVPVNYYACLDITAAKAIVDTMQGVEYDVDIEGTIGGDRTIEPGEAKLNGQQVVDYCRYLGESSDENRIGRQQRMMLAFFKQLKANNQIKSIPELYNLVSGYMSTDLNAAQIASLALFSKDIDPEKIAFHIVPGKTLVFTDDNNQTLDSYWGVDTNALAALINDIFGIAVSPDPVMDTETLSPLVEQVFAAKKQANDLIRRYQNTLSKYSVSKNDRKKFDQAAAQLQNTCGRSDYPSIQDEVSVIKNAIDEFKSVAEPIVNAAAKSGSSNASASPTTKPTSTPKPDPTPANTPVNTPHPVATPEPVLSPEPVITPEPLQTPFPIVTAPPQETQPPEDEGGNQLHEGPGGEEE